MSGVAGAPAWAADPLLDDPATTTLVCCGSGGVGKTTTAAALALRAAERGRRVLVLTVDPSRRLAQALGLDVGGAGPDGSEPDGRGPDSREPDSREPDGGGPGEPRPVPGVDARAGGSLHAAVLDARATLDGLVDAALDPAGAAALKANPVYASVAGAFSGTQEYMAMERLGQLQRRGSGGGGWDLVVVDTPPSRSALEFLDAPARLARFLDGRFARLLRQAGRPGGGLGRRLAGRVGGGVLAVMDRVLGAGLLRDTTALVQGLDAVFGGFQERAAATTAALAAPGSSFLVVTAAEADALAEASHLLLRLGDGGLPTAAVVVNRAAVVPAGLAGTSAERAEGAAAAAGPQVAALLALHAETSRTAAAQAAQVADLLAGHPGVAVTRVAPRPGGVADLDGLRAVGADLAG